MLDLLRLSMGEDAVAWSSAYWRWKHEANPFGPSPVLVAEEGGRLIGLRAFMRWTWRASGRDYAAVRAVDTATHPDYRGRGIFKRLTLQLRDEVAAEGTRFVFNTPNDQSRPGYLKMGWVSVGRPSLWVRPVRPLKLSRALRSGGLGGDEGPAPPVDAPRATEALSQWGDAVQDMDSAEEPLLHTACTSSYLTWRYAEVPGLEYYALREGEGADGACLFLRARQRGPLRELRICDIAVGSSPEARRSLLRLLRAVPDIADVDVVIAMGGGALGMRRALLRSGYLPAPRTGPVLTAYPLDLAPEMPDPRELGAWHASIGSLELL